MLIPHKRSLLLQNQWSSVACFEMQPEDGKTPKFSQIYIYDQDNELENQLQSFQNVHRTVLKELQIKEINPCAHLYQQAGDIMEKSYRRHKIGVTSL